jgi:hypothetical protein
VRFEELFIKLTRSADTADTSNSGIKGLGEIADSIPSALRQQKLQNDISAASAPALVPLDKAFTEGRRYRAAGVTEARNRLELYVEDPNGDWKRSSGVLIAVRSE